MASMMKGVEEQVKKTLRAVAARRLGGGSQAEVLVPAVPEGATGGAVAPMFGSGTANGGQGLSLLSCFDLQSWDSIYGLLTQ